MYKEIDKVLFVTTLFHFQLPATLGQPRYRHCSQASSNVFVEIFN